jgi:hypothetical protein
MVALRHVVVSDLHLGALNSVLTNVDDTGAGVDRSVPAPVTAALGVALRTLAGDDPPELVVLGDLFELALTPLDDAAAAFSQFAQSVGFGSPDGAFADRLHYLAGNHDHLLWTRARLDREVDLVTRTPVDAPLPEVSHVTPLFDPIDVDPTVMGPGSFVTALLARAGYPAVTVSSSYPNLGIHGADDRIVVLHHGHFIEPLYRMMSVLDDLFEAPGPPPTVVDLEADNAGWIDFFWSSAGDSGDAGTDVRMLYESLVSARTMGDELRRIALLVKLARRRRRLLAPLARILDLVSRGAGGAIVRRERLDPTSVLSPSAEAGLAAYLAGPVRQQLTEAGEPAPDDLTFVFGHTHKPFVGSRGVDGLGHPVAIANTGGWVVDHPDPEPLKGASAVLLDAAGNAAALQIYRQRADGTADPPVVFPIGRGGEALAADVRGTIEAAAAPWRALTVAVSTSLAARRRDLLDREQATDDLLRRAAR